MREWLCFFALGSGGMRRLGAAGGDEFSGSNAMPSAGVGYNGRTWAP